MDHLERPSPIAEPTPSQKVGHASVREMETFMKLGNFCSLELSASLLQASISNCSLMPNVDDFYIIPRAHAQFKEPVSWVGWGSCHSLLHTWWKMSPVNIICIMHFSEPFVSRFEVRTDGLVNRMNTGNGWELSKTLASSSDLPFELMMEEQKGIKFFFLPLP